MSNGVKFILTTKLNMTQLFTNDGKSIPVTVLQVRPTKIAQIKTIEKDGYEAVQIESGKYRREIPTETDGFKVGQEMKASDFEPGENVKVTGITKGRGFAGVMKRHGFHGFPASHGHPHQRAPGSIGSAFPQHVRKGMRMAGRMGGEKQTIKSMTIIAVLPEEGLLFVKGSVPGATGSLMKVVTTGKKKELSGVFEYGKEEKKDDKPKPNEEATAKSKVETEKSKNIDLSKPEEKNPENSEKKAEQNSVEDKPVSPELISPNLGGREQGEEGKK